MESTVFFIRGFMRSGTNWLNNILNLHPDINCIGEFHLQKLNRQFNNSISKFYDTSIPLYQDRGSELIKDAFNGFIKQTIKSYCGDYKIVGDRTPIGLVDFILPDCKYIVITRDGRDVIVSWFYHALKNNVAEIQQFDAMKEKQKQFQEDPNYFENNPSKLLDDKECFYFIAKAWNDTTLNNKLKIDRQVNKKNFYWLQYEHLHKNTEKLRSELYSFLGADPKTALPLDDYTKPGSFKINTINHNRKGKVGDWQNYFTGNNIKWYEEIASEAHALLDTTIL